MGDRCYLQLTLRRKDLDRFGAILSEPQGQKWWDEDLGEPASGIVCVALYDANYALYEEREQAAKDGIAFFGNHGEGGDYAGCAFAGLDGSQIEVYTDRDGLMCVQLDRNLRLLTDIGHLRSYIEKQRAVEKLFRIPVREDEPCKADSGDNRIGEHYLLRIIGDVEPELLGPYATALDRDHVAIDLRQRDGDADGLYRLDSTAGMDPMVSWYAAYELEPEERSVNSSPR